MKTFATAAVLLLAVTAYAASQKLTCYDTCNMFCGGLDNGCRRGKVFGDYCDYQTAVCQRMCTNMCQCETLCAAECDERFAECMGEEPTRESEVTCGFSRSTCDRNCRVNCNIGIQVAIVTALREDAKSFNQTDDTN